MIILTGALPNSLLPYRLLNNIEMRPSSADEVREILKTRKVTCHIPRANSVVAISEALDHNVVDDNPRGVVLEEVGDMAIWARYNGPWMDELARKMPEGGTIEFVIFEVLPVAHINRQLVVLSVDDFKDLRSFPIQFGDFVLGDKLVKIVTHYRNASIYAVIDDHIFMINHLTKQNILDYLEGNQ